MKAFKIACYTPADPRWDELTELYQRISFKDFIDLFKELYSDLMLEEPEEEEIVDAVEQESDGYLLKYDDSITPCVCIYQRPSVYELLPF